MEEKLLFSETQWFARQWWFILVLLLSVIVGVVIFFIGRGRVSANSLILGSGIPLTLIAIFIGMMHLTTKITTAKISVSFFPFSSFNKDISWEAIKAARIVSFKVSDFSLPGVRYRGLFGLKTDSSGGYLGYIVGGKEGLEIDLKDGQKILIETKKRVEIEKIIKEKNLVP